ncbi:hypothetical protein DICPUDRAFT_80554 [Dictyostelium purpureum]|uniref:Uncharacterized protein n=1 Tax=Dictyostelium purpureum TaxID=5786 RepID=F0ZQU3_DICPU|nr:uncharacterized protein DICPUDRAFT_80554 [Dictyostelium purpureum]EGC33668.1 hypothetical protein DICPUDRAFT_80554 [Dictyostelium purpureum]|eukprot:XP_003289787.1 hypothetical protein DICPUDRAFT_80554 [Dictyostelium purpureum]
MKVFALLVIILGFVSNCMGDTDFAIWNKDSQTAAAGLYDFANIYNTTEKYTLSGYQHINTTNQYSTYNAVTRVISFFATSLRLKIIFIVILFCIILKFLDLNIDFYPTKFTVLSIESSQTTNDTDLFLVMSVNPTTTQNEFIVTKTNAATGIYNIYDTVQMTFASASYDQGNKLFVVIVNNGTNNMVSTYDINGVFVRSRVYTIGNVNSNYKATSLPYNLVYLSSYSAFYMNIDLNGRPEIFLLYASTQQFYNKAWLQNTPYYVKTANAIGQSNGYIYQETNSNSKSYIP